MTETLSPILKRYGSGRLAFWCPGCDDAHAINCGGARTAEPTWSWNGNADRPTFQPSVLCRTGSAVDPSIVWEAGDPPLICHSFVTDGRIQFLGDSTHALAGQTVDLPPFPGDFA